jgi:hypothetical protein
MDEVKLFPELFEMMDKDKDMLRINSYGISITTMEEVFLRVANLEEDALQKKPTIPFLERKQSILN